MYIEGFGKLWHIPENLGGHAHVQGYSCSKNRPKKARIFQPLADLEGLYKQELTFKAHL